MTTASSPPTFLSTRRGKLTLALLCSVAFLDFVDASIVGVALPAIRRALHFTVEDLQWIPSGYLLTYGGFMLLGGRAADLIGRRRVLIAGTVTIGVASLLGGLSASSGMLIGARLAQGCGAAMMLPAALSILTTTFRDGRERNTALGVWGGVGGLASAAGVLLGGLLTDGLGWRWVLFVNPIAAVLVLCAILRLIAPDARRPRLENVDLPGALLATGGMLLLVYTLVEAPTAGWGAARTIGGLAGAGVLLAAFVVNELHQRNPLAPLSIFRINGLGFADVTQLIAFAGFLAMFFFLTLYMQNVLGFSPLQTGLAYLPLCFVIGICAGIASQLITRVGTRPLIVVGALISAGGLFWLSRIPVHGSYVANLLPGLIVVSIGFGPVFVAVTTAANAGVPADKAGLAASLLNASQQLGGALGLAILTALATTRTHDLLARHAAPASALTSGFQRALFVGSLFILAAAFIALRATNTRGEPAEQQPGGVGAGAGSPARPIAELDGVVV
ncbi:MAG TPA: MFS transporter [Solirubrobacteraceae bacterium]|jgi:EmrB/QacA subfamily drug resistance transporter|nr:MFS transporter [Solirubrobacteraceae bacterium]